MTTKYSDLFLFLGFSIAFLIFSAGWMIYINYDAKRDKEFEKKYGEKTNYADIGCLAALITIWPLTLFGGIFCGAVLHAIFDLMLKILNYEF